MRTLHRYLLRQILANAVMTVAVFTFVLLLGNVLKDIFDLLISRQATLVFVVKGVLLLIPYVLSFALPMGLLTATLLVFGRFSADNELTAARSCGLSLVALIYPVVIVAMLFSGLCGLINFEIAPYCRTAYKAARDRILMDVGLNTPESLLREQTFIRDFPGRIIYIGKVQKERLEDIIIWNFGTETSEESFIRAASGKLVVDRVKHHLSLLLTNVYHIQKNLDPIPIDESQLPPFELDSPPSVKPKLSDMTFGQLRAELAELEAAVAAGSTRAAAKESSPVLLEKLRTLAGERADITLPVRVQLHRRVAFSFACLGFTLIGVPLGIRAHRRETSAGIAIALLLVVVYFGFLILGQALETRPGWHPGLILWVPNFLFQGIGAWLIWRANR